MGLGLLWGIAAAVLVIVEMFTMEFTCLSLAIGCLMGGAAASFGAPVAVQLGAALVGAVAGLGLLAPTLRRRIAPKDTATGLDALPGSEAIVVEAIQPPSQGKVKLDGVVWQAVSAEPIPVGASVMITEVDGACLTVMSQSPLHTFQKTPVCDASPDSPRSQPQPDALSN